MRNCIEYFIDNLYNNIICFLCKLFYIIYLESMSMQFFIMNFWVKVIVGDVNGNYIM